MTDMFLDHEEAKELTTHKRQTSNMARCYLDLVEKCEALQKREQKITKVYIVVAKAPDDFTVIAIYANEDDANNHLWDLATLNSRIRSEVEERTAHYEYYPMTQSGRG